MKEKKTRSGRKGEIGIRKLIKTNHLLRNDVNRGSKTNSEREGLKGDGSVKEKEFSQSCYSGRYDALMYTS